jgi:hypothetical protein
MVNVEVQMVKVGVQKVNVEVQMVTFKTKLFPVFLNTYYLWASSGMAQLNLCITFIDPPKSPLKRGTLRVS